MKIAYFDNAATTFPKPEEVYVFMDKFYRECGVNVGRGQHKLSAMAHTLTEETRELLLKLMHCENKKVIFTSTATEALNLILRGLDIPNGACVYISPFEHNAVTRTLFYLQKNRKIDVELLDVDNTTLDFNIAEIERQFFTKKPYCIIVSHASNVCGTVAPIFEIFSAAKKYNAITIADMCQTAGLVDIDISSDVYDYVVFEGHKTLYGPMGVGGFIAKQEIKLSPLIYGGTGIESANQEMPDEIPIRYEVGSHNIHAIAGLNAALKWINKIGISEVYNREQLNKSRLIELLKKYSNITLIEPQNSIGVVSCNFTNYNSDSIGEVLSRQNIAVRTGLHCAPYAHKFLGTFPTGTVRFSVGYFNTDEDFEMLEQALDYIEDNS